MLALAKDVLTTLMLIVDASKICMFEVLCLVLIFTFLFAEEKYYNYLVKMIYCNFKQETDTLN